MATTNAHLSSLQQIPCRDGIFDAYHQSPVAQLLRDATANENGGVLTKRFDDLLRELRGVPTRDVLYAYVELRSNKLRIAPDSGALYTTAKVVGDVLAGRSALVIIDALGDLTVGYPEIVNHVISEAVHPGARGHWDEDYVNSALLGRLTRSAHDLLERELGCTRDRYLRHVSHPDALSTTERALVRVLVPTWQGTVAELYETAQELSRKPS